MSSASLPVKTRLVVVQSVLHSICGVSLNQGEPAIHAIMSSAFLPVKTLLFVVRPAPHSRCASVNQLTTTALPVTEAKWESLHIH